jgi:protein-disulfide isomerase
MNSDSKPRIAAMPLSPVDHVIGPPSAHVIVIEYGDFECPICAQAHQTMKILLKHYGHRIRFAFRQFPLVDAHPHAELAAEAAEVAGAQQKFWPMYEKLFDNQQHLKAKALRRYAEDIGLDMERYDAEMADHLYLQRVQEHLASGRASGVRTTPAFFVDGSVVDVSFGMERLSEALAQRAGKPASKHAKPNS